MEYLTTNRHTWYSQPWYTSNNPLERRIGEVQMLGPSSCGCRCGYYGRRCYCNRNCEVGLHDKYGYMCLNRPGCGCGKCSRSCGCVCGRHGLKCYCRKCTCEGFESKSKFLPASNKEGFRSRYLHGPSREYVQRRYIPSSARVYYDVGGKRLDYGPQYVPSRKATVSFIPKDYWYSRGKHCECSSEGCKCVISHPVPHYFYGPW